MIHNGAVDWLAAEHGGITGIDFLDQCLSPPGSPAVLYGLLGPIGVGKSTLGAMIAVEGAKAEYARRLRGEVSRTWVYLNLDGNPSDVQERLFSHAAKISRIEPDRRSVLQCLSSTGACRDYEVERAALRLLREPTGQPPSLPEASEPDA